MTYQVVRPWQGFVRDYCLEYISFFFFAKNMYIFGIVFWSLAKIRLFFWMNSRSEEAYFLFLFFWVIEWVVVFSAPPSNYFSHKNGSFFLLEAISFTHSSQISGTSIQKEKSLQMKEKGYYVSVSRDTFLLHNYFSLTVVLPLRVDISWLRMVTSRLRVKWST